MVGRKRRMADATTAGENPGSHACHLAGADDRKLRRICCGGARGHRTRLRPAYRALCPAQPGDSQRPAAELHHPPPLFLATRTAPGVFCVLSHAVGASVAGLVPAVVVCQMMRYHAMNSDARGKVESHADRVQYHHPLPVAAWGARWDRLLARETRQPPAKFFDHLDSGSPPEEHTGVTGELDDPELPCRTISSVHLRASGGVPEFPQPRAA